MSQKLYLVGKLVYKIEVYREHITFSFTPRRALAISFRAYGAQRKRPEQPLHILMT